MPGRKTCPPGIFMLHEEWSGISLSLSQCHLPHQESHPLDGIPEGCPPDKLYDAISGIFMGHCLQLPPPAQAVSLIGGVPRVWLIWHRNCAKLLPIGRESLYNSLCALLYAAQGRLGRLLFLHIVPNLHFALPWYCKSCFCSLAEMFSLKVDTQRCKVV